MWKTPQKLRGAKHTWSGLRSAVTTACLFLPDLAEAHSSADQCLSAGNNISPYPSCPRYLGLFLPNAYCCLPSSDSWAEEGLGKLWMPQLLCLGQVGGHSTTATPLTSMPLALASLASRMCLSFLGGHSMWLRDFLSRRSPAIILGLTLVRCELPQIPSRLEMPVPLSEEKVLHICAKANPVLSCLFWHLMPSTHTRFQKPKKASHPTVSPGHLAPAQCLMVSPTGVSTRSVQTRLLVSPCWKPSLGLHTVHPPLWQLCLCPFGLCHPLSCSQLDLVSSFCAWQLPSPVESKPQFSIRIISSFYLNIQTVSVFWPINIDLKINLSF